MRILSYLLYNIGALQIQYWRKSIRFQKLYYKKENINSSNEKIKLIYMADGRIDSGGLADRLFGIISLYKLCKEHNFIFKINFCSPFNLEDYFLPKYPWKCSSKDLIYSKAKSLPLIIFCSFKKYKVKLQLEAQLQQQYLENQIKKNKNNKDLHIYTNAHWVITPQEYSTLFHELFTLDSRLQQAVNENKKKTGNNYIAIVLRFQNSLGDFAEADCKAIKEIEQKKLIEKCKKKILDLHSNSHPNSIFLVTSDSSKFLESLADLEFVRTISGRVVHMSYTLEKDYNLHLKSFIDLIMLSEADKIYLLVTNYMYHSGFAQSASFINNKEYQEIFF